MDKLGKYNINPDFKDNSCFVLELDMPYMYSGDYIDLLLPDGTGRTAETETPLDNPWQKDGIGDMISKHTLTAMNSCGFKR